MTPDRLAALRSAAQLLHRPRDVRDPADLARAICGAQAQDHYAGRLAFRARSRTLTAADVDRARNEDRSLVRTWAMRRTMHLLASDDVGWLLPLFEPAIVATSRRRLAQLGLDAAAQAKAVDTIRRALERGEPRVRDELVGLLERAGIHVTAARRVHLVCLVVALGVACQGPDIGTRGTLVSRREWLGEHPRHDRGSALRELAVRYLRAFGPATDADFAGWSGLGLRDVRAGLAAAADRVEEVRLAGGRAWRLRGRARRARGRVVRLLGAYDTYLMGHRDREFIAAPRRWRRVMPGGGILRPTVVADGAAIATWGLRRKGEIRVEVDPFIPLGQDLRAALAAEVEDVARFEAADAAPVIVARP